VFAQHPTAILEMFLLMGQQNIRHIRTRTLRILKIAARGIDEHFRNDPVNKAMFMDNIKEQNLLFWRLRVMKRYGVLGSYLPAFGQITGLMQYDLFHRYTVDAHILPMTIMLILIRLSVVSTAVLTVKRCWCWQRFSMILPKVGAVTTVNLASKMPSSFACHMV
jgi:UTP:GlnB (protein PII) uridylyltransferase